jgi:hypothetical protein
MRQPVMKRVFPVQPRDGWIAVTVAAAMLAHCAAAAEASQHGPAAHGSAEAAAEEGSDANSSGIKLGEFKVRTDYPVEAQKCTVRFVLYVAVDGERSAELRRLVENHRQKIRDVVIIATRLAPLNVFQEPDLAKFRRRILARLRHNLPELAFDNLYISEFGLLVRTL